MFLSSYVEILIRLLQLISVVSISVEGFLQIFTKKQKIFLLSVEQHFKNVNKATIKPLWHSGTASEYKQEIEFREQ